MARLKLASEISEPADEEDEDASHDAFPALGQDPSEFGLSVVAAAALAAGFSLPGSVLRALGGSLADRLGPHKVTWWGLWSHGSACSCCRTRIRPLS